MKVNRKQIDELVNALEEKIEKDGFLKLPSIFDNLKQDFGEEIGTLILQNLGVKQLNQGKYQNAENIFRQAIWTNQNNPYLHMFWGISVLKSAHDTNEIDDAKKILDTAKKLFREEAKSNYKTYHLDILDEYLKLFRSSWKERFFTKDKKVASIHNDLSGANIANFANRVGDNARQQVNQYS